MTIKLHVGYVGKTRDGKRVEIVDYEPEKPWPYVDNEGETYWENGGYMRHEPRQGDIIAPWVDDTAPEYNNGKWHGWNGGECPVHHEALIFTLNAGSGEFCWIGKANDFDWQSFHGAFRVVTPYVEPPKPREFWVWSDCKGRVNHVFTTKTTKDDVHFLVGDEIIHVREVLDTWPIT